MALQVVPVVSALKRNKTSAVLVVLQVALMLTFISNLVSIVWERAATVLRPTGTAEQSLFAIGFRLTGAPQNIPNLQADLAAVRASPGVEDAIATNAYPLRGTGWGEGISLMPGPTTIQQQQAQTAIYLTDEHGVGTLGLKLVAGRNFRAEEVEAGHLGAGPLPGVAIISRALARQLFGDKGSLGRIIYFTADAKKPVTVVGVVERLQSPYAAGSIDAGVAENSVLLPLLAAGGSGLLVVRARPGALKPAMQAVRNTLLRVNPERILGRLRPFDEIRRTAYQKDRAIAVAFGILFLILSLVTALSIVGITSFWVVRRTVQIGIRRALGATQSSIVRYFLVENVLLCSAGTLLGITLSLVLNVWVRTHYATDRISALALIACAFMVVSLGQCAAIAPVLRASRVPPSQAFRSA
jgi:putative ABC transport system permease protein